MKKRFAFYLFLALPVCLLAQKTQNKIPEKPKLIVGIVVEQMRYDYLQKYWNKFGKYGFKRLIKQGTLCKNAQYDYAFNHDAVGYASISTGTTPSQHGIIGNSWYSRLKKKQVYAVDDNQARTVGAQSEAGNYSPRNLMAGTLGDALKMASMGKSKVIGLALKDCAAILPSGRAADGAFWLDEKSGNWITSSFYTRQLPFWVTRFNNQKHADKFMNERWETELPLAQYTESLDDVNDYETGLFGYKKAFPYYFDDLRKRTKDYSLLKVSPFGNTLTRDFAISAFVNEKLGKDKHTDLLLMGFSQPGYLSQYFKPNSVETEDTYIKLDKDIAYFVNFLDRQIGKENYLLFLTSNTGAANSQGYLQQMRMSHGLFNHHTAIPLLRSYLKAIYGQKANWILHYEELQVYLDHEAILRTGKSVAEVQNQIAQFLVGFDGVANAFTASTLQNTDFSAGIAQKIKKSFSQKRSADILLVLQPGWVQQDESADHNSAYNYDTHVPLIWYGWKVKPKIITSQLSIADIAVTIATYLNIPKPDAATGKHIWELAD